MASEPNFKQAQQRVSSVPPDQSDEEKFLAILNNRGKTETRSAKPPRQSGFVVLARGGNNLKSLQSLCFDTRQSWNTCLTARYRLQPGAVFGSLIVAFLADLQKILRGESNSFHGDLSPNPSDETWNRMLAGGLQSFLASLHTEQQGVLAPDRLEEFLKLLAEESVLSKGTRLVLFGEVSEAGKDGAEWRRAYTSLMRRLPERFGLVLSGAPENFYLPTEEARFLEINLPEDGAAADAAETERIYKYKLPPIHSDRAAREDRLGINAYAEALARFVLHEQTTAPLTIGIHGPWGKGKSSFMELIKIALIKWAKANRVARMQKLADLQAVIEQKQAEAEKAPEQDRAKLTAELAAKITEREKLWQQMQRDAEKETLVVHFNAWQFDDARQIWAGLASVVSECIEGVLSRRTRLWTRIAYAWNKRRVELLLNLILPLAAVLLAGIYLIFGGAAQLVRLAESVPGDKDLPVFGGLLKILLPSGSVLFLLWFAAWRILKVVQPVSERVLGYVQMPNYREQMGYQHQVMDDLRFVNNTLQRHRPKCKVVVYIDDLDRCSEEKIMETLQAINLILGNSEFFVFLGMDTEMIHRAIRVHYRKNQKDEPLPDDFSENYLRKIVQLSFYLPETSPQKRFEYVSTLFSATARRELEQMAANEKKADGQKIMDAAPASDGAWPYDLALVQKPVRQQLEEVEDTAEELAAFRDYQEFLEDNPREIKRLVNVHRLVKILLQQRQEISWPAERQRKLVKWLIFCAQWPDLIDDLLTHVQNAPSAANCLDNLLGKLEVPAGAFNHLKEFAGHKDVLSSQDIDDDFSLAAYVSQMVRDSAAPLKRAPKQYGYLFPHITPQAGGQNLSKLA
jgi:hypothetical protein